MSALGSARGTIRAVALSSRRSPALPWHVEAASGMGLLLRALDWLRRDTVLRRSRRDLLELTSDQLRDVGLTRGQALAEARRSRYLD